MSVVYELISATCSVYCDRLLVLTKSIPYPGGREGCNVQLAWWLTGFANPGLRLYSLFSSLKNKEIGVDMLTHPLCLGKSGNKKSKLAQKADLYRSVYFSSCLLLSLNRGTVL